MLFGGGPERRRRGRVHVSMAVEVHGADGPARAVLKDLSTGGARVLAEAQVATGTALMLLLPSLGAGGVTVSSRVVRATQTHRGWLLGIKFEGLQDPVQESLRRYIHLLLSGPGGDKRQHPRLARRLPVRAPQLGDERCFLDRISLNGLSLFSHCVPEMGAAISMALLEDDGTELISLTGRVVHLQRLKSPDDEQHLVGVAFDAMAFEKRALLDHLLSAWT